MLGALFHILKGTYTGYPFVSQSSSNFTFLDSNKLFYLFEESAVICVSVCHGKFPYPCIPSGSYSLTRHSKAYGNKQHFGCPEGFSKGCAMKWCSAW